MREMLVRSLERLWAEVENLNRPVAGSRVPGVMESEVEEVLGGAVPEDIVTWFGWSNGVEYLPGQIQDDAFLVPGYEPLSLREARAVRESYGIDEAVLGEHWTPLLATGGGDFYAAVHGTSLKDSRVVHVMMGGESLIVYKTVEEMVNAFCGFYRSGVFFVSAQGTLEADDEIWVAAELESGSAA
ncbi:SMI1/KNR4 family protein [Streptomyces acidiscabies]|uniref:SMI1/KNR4 family protein n=1 Tax=Streptomyces acidiscabies TaxID=42234 RepID=A0AAP6EKK2_9ACTN|nr:SMI1/KNR4 family protein [Streptomyces acidiscabies]MBP5937329.1 SMI1/KNR4 family protein [Streptomyces sp. LBUM 1476]MBZ3914604.1 SMI1/KNR4 family protein [Streptomyces acidiscabies]MDX2966154.1 SMI1/KNR4 family protein [Streptomyces acidiscabies]MDX3025577.1 SMI1/KNR4 family protein [Streptomyces acidiscabies]MDX3796146.1 SMI1/KNR4 family protein [Streptomyces acidiscabies]